ncbi:hypothetical protein GN958_ATG10023 [Phytophthora infestans]|uniref:Uncharacterized protein n=1 Tax=Phytophthora infestans TaxID=4787 RepID=A0A8S9UP21_PHYIN|nr:hypothetical protein GN958_ATG10023 [Phytophthora infestans]
MPTPVRKTGETSKTSRSNVDVDNASFALQEGQCFMEFSTEVEARVTDALRRYKSETVRPDPNIYVKPGQTSRQRDFVSLSERSFTTMMAAARANHQRRSQRAGRFVVELFTFDAKKSINLTGTRRAIAPRIQEAAYTIDAFLTDRPSVEVGEIDHTHWSVTHARQPEGTELAVPDTAAFAQAQHIAAMREAEGVEAEPIYRTMAVRISGFTDLPMTIDVVEF